MVVAALMFLATNADATKNANGKFALHYAGAHDAKLNTCSYLPSTCGDIVVDGGSGGPLMRYDVYIIAADVAGIAGLRYGITADGPLFFYGWTNCADFEIPTPGWPGADEANAHAWSIEQPGPFVTVGILDMYVYPTTVSLSTTIDDRVGKAEWCDANQPSPICVDITDTAHFATVGFNGNPGTDPCGEIPTKATSWGQVKALYR